MTLVGFAILVIIAALVITQSQKPLPPPVIEELIEEPVAPKKSSRWFVIGSLVVIFIWVVTIIGSLYGIWLHG